MDKDTIISGICILLGNSIVFGVTKNYIVGIAILSFGLLVMAIMHDLIKAIKIK